MVIVKKKCCVWYVVGFLDGVIAGRFNLDNNFLIVLPTIIPSAVIGNNDIGLRVFGS